MKIPMSSCYKEDTGLYCLGEGRSSRAGALVIYADHNAMFDMLLESPELFDQDRLKNAKPDKDGLFYVPYLYTDEVLYKLVGELG